MDFELEKVVPHQHTVLFNGRFEASVPALVHLVHEYFNSLVRAGEVPFGEGFCWMGFRPILLGSEEHVYYQIQSNLGHKDSDSNWLPYYKLDIPETTIAYISIRALSPIASRVIIGVYYTPDVLSRWFGKFAQYLHWEISGHSPNEAWSLEAPENPSTPIIQIDVPAVPQLPAPHERGALPPGQITASDPNPPSTEEAKTKASKGRKRKAKAPVPRQTKNEQIPKTFKALERWRKIYRAILKAEAYYLDPPNGEMEDRPNPTLDDLREAVKVKLKRKLSAKTIERVKAAGDAGLLKIK